MSKLINAIEEYKAVFKTKAPVEVQELMLKATKEERSLFSQVQYMPYSTFAVKMKNFSKGKSEVGYLRENMSLDRQGHPMAWIKRYADEDAFTLCVYK